MFEYLMPLLFTQTHENSLLDRACDEAVRCQMAYARKPRAVGDFGIRLQRARHSQRLSDKPLVSRRWR